MFRCCLKNIFSDFCQTNYLNVYRTDLHEIYRIGRTLAVDERREVIFFDLSRDVAIATNFFWGGIDLQYTNTHRVVHMTFARAAPAYNKKGNCYAGRRQTNYLIRWTHANQFNDQLTIINRRRGG